MHHHAANPDIVELREDVSSSPYFSHDMAPVSAARRVWGARDLAVLWISLSACVPTYLQASSAIKTGLNWWQAVATIFLANCIVLIPMSLNAHAGTRYGIPFPVYCRAAFGMLGANVPAIIRALVACGWFGIQTWIGGNALYITLGVWFPEWKKLADIEFLEINPAQLGCFLAFWTINVYIVWRGIDSIRLLLRIKAPLLVLLGFLFLGWAYVAADGFGSMFAQESAFREGGPLEGKFWKTFLPLLNGNIGFWGTLALNIPDFTRYAKSQRDQIVGQAAGMPTTMGLYAFIGVAVTSVSTVIFNVKDPIWDPEEVLERIGNPTVLVVGMGSLCLATLATNIAANVVGPANDIANLKPKWISFRMGGLITGLIGVLIQPWRLLKSVGNYVFVWLNGVSIVLGACGGVLIADYWFLRRRRLDLAGLYREDGPYWYRNGWNPAALIATALGTAPCIPGLLAALTLIEPVHEFWSTIYDVSWFVSFGISFVTYLVMMQMITPLTESGGHRPAPSDDRIKTL